jgi:L-threonylcarbamoyladenylate synthase
MFDVGRSMFDVRLIFSSWPMPVLEQAILTLTQGGIVAFPTETVYGLGADATNPSAIDKIFKAKGRPPTNPLIVHVADIAIARQYTTAWTPIAQKLAEQFWPGPLTLVLPKAEAICAAVTAGGKTVGLRVPNHPLALELLRGFDGPIAAPSANRANHISPTTAEHVRDELGDRVDLILDGGPCAVGIESTVLDLSSTVPKILRPGGVSKSQIESIIGLVDLFDGTVDEKTAAASPGQQARHYSPLAPAYRFERAERNGFPRPKHSVVLLIEPEQTLAAAVSGADVIAMPANPQAYAAVLYQTLRKADSKKPVAIFIEMPPYLPEWTAVRDRLMRATVLMPSINPGLRAVSPGQTPGLMKDKL